jgi:hypothetical protein
MTSNRERIAGRVGRSEGERESLKGHDSSAGMALDGSDRSDPSPGQPNGKRLRSDPTSEFLAGEKGLLGKENELAGENV